MALLDWDKAVSAPTTTPSPQTSTTRPTATTLLNNISALSNQLTAINNSLHTRSQAREDEHSHVLDQVQQLKVGLASQGQSHRMSICTPLPSH